MFKFDQNTSEKLKLVGMKLGFALPMAIPAIILFTVYPELIASDLAWRSYLNAPIHWKDFGIFYGLTAVYSLSVAGGIIVCMRFYPLNEQRKNFFHMCNAIIGCFIICVVPIISEIILNDYGKFLDESGRGLPSITEFLIKLEGPLIGSVSWRLLALVVFETIIAAGYFYLSSLEAKYMLQYVVFVYLIYILSISSLALTFPLFVIVNL